MAGVSQCSVESGKHSSGRLRQGLCRRHYTRLLTYGDPEFLHSLTCVECGRGFQSERGGTKFCSHACKKLSTAASMKDYHASRQAAGVYVPSQRGLNCSICGERMWRGSDTATSGKAAHNRCRTYNPDGSRKHGIEPTYRAGCRCDECKAGNARRAREYNASYKAVHGVSYSVHYEQKRTEAGDPATGRVRNWITRERRRSIYERDGWVCHLCGDECPREFDVNDRKSPTLDHLVPVSMGGSNESSNLKLACWSCNASRGNRVIV